MQRVLEALQRSRKATPLQPPGHRSGRGSRSLEPYLQEARKSRPARLDD